jgi:hypothetical protein
MTAEEFALVAILTNQQEQVTIRRLNVEHFDLGIGTKLRRDLEELASTIRPNVERHQTRGAQTTSWSIHDLESCSDPGELVVEECGIHAVLDTDSDGKVR